MDVCVNGVVIMVGLAVIAFLPSLFSVMVFGGKEINSFQIHDDCPDWFMERVNKHLDKMLKG